MLFKRHIPLFIVIFVGLLTLFGHFIKNENIQNFVNNDATQWFDIIASFAIFLGAFNLLKLQFIKVIKKQINWQYSILAIFGFIFSIFAGFFFRGANYITLSDYDFNQITQIAPIIYNEVQESDMNSIIEEMNSNAIYKIDKIYFTQKSAQLFIDKLLELNILSSQINIRSVDWGVHVQTEGSLFHWMFFNIFTPLSATMFALLAFFVASASYRAFRIRNFEATLLLVAGIILMLGRVPVGKLIPWWSVIIMYALAFGAIAAPFIKSRVYILLIICSSSILFIALGFILNWNSSPPLFLTITAIQDWIFDYPTAAGSRALMIGIALGIIATSFRIIVGIERSFLGE